MYKEFLKRFTPCFCVPQRYILGIMASMGIMSAYSMRICLAMALTEMIYKNGTSADLADTCPILENDSYTAVKDMESTYQWSEEVQGTILGSLYWGYIMSHLPGAIIADRYGAKHVIEGGMLISVVLTLLTVTILNMTNGNWQAMLAIRIILGFGQGVVYPCLTSMIAQWVPQKQRGSMSSLVYAGALMGTALTNLISGILITTTANWRSVFYFFGVVGVIWLVLWQLLCYSYPTTHPCIKPEEAAYLEAELAGLVQKDKTGTPWKGILTSPRVWVLVVGQFGHDWGWFTLVINLPKYLNAVLRFNVQQTGLLLSFPYLITFGTTVGSGYLADWLINNNHLKLLTTRRIFTIIGQMGPAVFMVLASYAGCKRTAAVALFTVSLALMGVYFPGMKINAMDLSPNYAGTIMALSNGLGVIGGMAAPVIVGCVAPNQTLSEWRLVFWICFFVLAVTTIIFVAGMSGEIQNWNKQEEEAKEN